MSLDNAFTADELAAWADRVERDAAAPACTTCASSRSTGVAINLVYEDGRLVRALTRGDGAHRRGRHAQRPHPRRRCPSRLQPATTCPALLEVRGEVFFPVEGFADAQRRAGRGRQGAVRQPAQRRRRLAAAEGPAGHRAAGRCGWSCTASAPARASAPTRQSEAYDALRGLGPAGQRPVPRSSTTWTACRSYIDHYGEHRHDVEHEIDGVVVKVDEVSRAAPARLDVAGAALGDRVQVPAGGGHDQAARHPGQRRPHRPGHAVRRAWSRSSSAARPSSMATLHNAVGGRAQGRAHRRHRRAAQGRRRDPRDRRPGRRPARRHRARVRDADASARRAAPRCGRRRRATPTSAAPTPGPAPPSCGSGCSTSPAAARSTSRCSATRRRSRCSTPGWCRTRATSSTSTRTSCSQAPLFRRKDGGLTANGAQAARQPRGRQAAAAVAGRWSPCRSGTSARPPRRRWPASCGSIERDRRAPTPSELAAVDGRRAGRSPRPARVVRRRLAPRDRREVAGRRRPARGGGRRRRARGRSRALTRRGHRLARGLLPRRRHRGDPGPRRQGRPARCRRRPTSSSWGTSPGSKYDKAVQLGVPVLDEAGFRVLLEQGPDAARAVGRAGRHARLTGRSGAVGGLQDAARPARRRGPRRRCGGAATMLRVAEEGA